MTIPVDIQAEMAEPVVASAPIAGAPTTYASQKRRLPVSMQALFSNKKATFGLLLLIFFLLVSVLAPVISPGDAMDIVAKPRLAPSSEHWFGTTAQGQDVFDQTVWGTRNSLWLGLAVGLLTTLVGIVFGMTAGFFRGRLDDVLSMTMNVFLIIPALPLLVVLSAFISGGTNSYYLIVLTLTGWAWGARVIRSQTLSLREKDFVSASKVSGEHSSRIIFSELLPNMLSIIVAGLFGATIYAIGAMAGLEFIGLGNPSVVTWGTNLYWASNNAALMTGAWWTIVPSGLCIALVAFSLAMMNYAIDEITNPRLRAQREIANALSNSQLRATRNRSTPVLREPI